MATTTQAKAGPRRSAHDRLLDAANELFYNEGVQTVGIDRFIEHAGVAKASLYNTFGSKEELVRANLESGHARTTQRLTAAVEMRTDSKERLLAVFDAQGELCAQPNIRGRAFVTASAEAHPGGLVEQAADDYRDDIRAFLTPLAAEAAAPDPATLGRQLHLIYDGPGISARMDRDPSVAVGARAAAAGAPMPEHSSTTGAAIRSSDAVYGIAATLMITLPLVAAIGAASIGLAPVSAAVGSESGQVCTGTQMRAKSCHPTALQSTPLNGATPLGCKVTGPGTTACGRRTGGMMRAGASSQGRASTTAPRTARGQRTAIGNNHEKARCHEQRIHRSSHY
jgi:AcrR family transcriptional regulator